MRDSVKNVPLSKLEESNKRGAKSAAVCKQVRHNNKDQKMKSATKQARFSVNERVLCYEPDLTKARVVYDAKILKVECPRHRKNPGPKDFHYLVHFQGWSATWDRYVTEEFLLKVNTENKDLQKKLFQEAEAAR